jgi:hypothetical protein
MLPPVQLSAVAIVFVAEIAKLQEQLHCIFLFKTYNNIDYF